MKINQVQEIIKAIDEIGFVVIEDVYSEQQMTDAIEEIESKIDWYENLQAENGLGTISANSAHHITIMCPTTLALLNPNPTNEILNTFFGGNYILNTMGVSICQPQEGYNYTMEIHRDIRSFSSSNRLYINGVLLLDDSTVDNGATHMIKKEHNIAEKPSDEYFDANSVRIEAKRGDVILFDGNMWHKAGINHTSKPRRIISQMFTKPFIKQQLDYPRAFGNDFQYRISDELKQILGYNARTPSNLDEFYKPREKRFYKSDQG